MLAYERRGSGPPLVLLHGIGSRWQVWSPVLDRVARERDVIALDLPGFGASPGLGASPAGRRPGSVADLADRVADFLDRLGVETPHVAGSSLGGGIALELGRRGVARSVVAFAPVGFWRRPGLRWGQFVVRGARAAANGLAPVLPSLLATRAGRAALCGIFYAHPTRLSPTDATESAAALAAAPGFPAACAAFVDARFEPPYPGIPVTIAWGTRDLVLPRRAQARRARTLLPDAEHVTLHGCGHLPFPDDPDACARLLLRNS
jgi:pimeloyl-ACP methyl ester carboxylesterase